MKYKELKRSVHNRGIAPDEFLDAQIAWANGLGADEDERLFGLNAEIDAYTWVRDELGKPYKSLLHRKAVMLEVQRVLAGFESSWNFSEGRDVNNENSTDLYQQEAGVFQTSANSVVFDPTGLKNLFRIFAGKSWQNNDETYKLWINRTKSNTDFAFYWTTKVLRKTVRHHGPLLRKEINPFLSRGAVAEYIDILSGDGIVDEPVKPVDTGKYPKIPRNYDDVRRIFGEPCNEDNLALCEVPNELKCFPKLTGLGNKRGFRCHKLLVPVFGDVFREIVDKGLASEVYAYDGVYNCRSIGGSASKSLHSWGIAIDLNAEDNERGSYPGKMDERVIKVFQKHGFFAGKYFKSTPDPMHFEWMSYT